MAAFVSPRSGWLGRLQTALGNASGLRAILRHLPFVTLESDVRDIVYLNWVIPAAAVADLVPPRIRIVEHGGMTVLTVLTYAHGDFGPALAGPLRRLFPSPRQSNWRLYVETIDGETPTEPTVLFLHTLFDSAAYAVGTRLFSDALPSHLSQVLDHDCRDGACHTRIDGGTGSAPSLSASTTDTTERMLPAIFAPFHDGWDQAIATLCLQDAAVAAFGHDQLASATIDLPIDPASVVPAQAAAFEPGDWLRSVGATDLPFAFRVPRVRFRALSEAII